MPESNRSYSPKHSLHIFPADPVYDGDAFHSARKKLENRVAKGAPRTRHAAEDDE